MTRDDLGRSKRRASVTCFARACRQRRPCATQATCERVWHLCDVDRFLFTRVRCPVCGATWTADEHGVWHRDPLPD